MFVESVFAAIVDVVIVLAVNWEEPIVENMAVFPVIELVVMLLVLAVVATIELVVRVPVAIELSVNPPATIVLVRS